ncbi:hypothetical protein AAIB41_18070 [Brucella sp. BE17]|uniref:hypothetical protein n=1 Tax=Brucella sp. BE17 TaxID=3142977 RepID=UPI0031B9F36F
MPVKGIVWQVDNATAAIKGDWDKLGADTLLVQWSQVDNISFLGGGGDPKSPIDWFDISQQPWAKNVILGLAGRFSEPEARANVLELAEQSARLARKKLPVNITGYYFPVEVDSSWHDAPQLMPKALAQLPRPLWISVYEGHNIGAKEFADWVASWLPPDVGIFFQDGVGVEVRSPAVARDYADALVKRLGKQRVRIIVEAFRPIGIRGFRPATADELLPQIKVMRGYNIFIFDGPHYIKSELIDELIKHNLLK